MLSIVLDPTRTPIALAGRGDAAVRRLARLRAAGVGPVRVFSDRPSADLATAAGDDLHAWLPEPEDLAGIRALWIADLPRAVAHRLAGSARACGTLVNVEDMPALCDFHNTAEVRRGDLLITVSTGGRSPGLAARIRRSLAAAFGPEWAGRLDAVATERALARAEGLTMPDVARRTDRVVATHGWLR